jgi:adenine phosphoribosyltransferase
VPLRKKGKLPAETLEVSYQKEYGLDTIQIHKDALTEDDIVILHDDILATGGTIKAAIELIKKFNVKKIYVSFIGEIDFLKGRDKIENDVDVDVLIHF